mmetsp:Transcript_117004/g.268561  ORF Transcript_117004/g.268561 Transcript_117004/m.268561 type:complete len:118 (-) Transcript_117004:50-403(-)
MKSCKSLSWKGLMLPKVSKSWRTLGLRSAFWGTRFRPLSTDVCMMYTTSGMHTDWIFVTWLLQTSEADFYFQGRSTVLLLSSELPSSYSRFFAEVFPHVERHPVDLSWSGCSLPDAV